MIKILAICLLFLFGCSNKEPSPWHRDAKIVYNNSKTEYVCRAYDIRWDGEESNIGGAVEVRDDQLTTIAICPQNQVQSVYLVWHNVQTGERQ